jgi:endonuclease III
MVMEKTLTGRDTLTVRTDVEREQIFIEQDDAMGNDAIVSFGATTCRASSPGCRKRRRSC